MPIRQIQLRDGTVRRQRCRIDNPRVRNEFQQPLKKLLAELLPPELAEIAVPEQRKQHFFLECGFGRRSEENSFLTGEFKNCFGVRHIGQIEQLEETINRVAVVEIRKR